MKRTACLLTLAAALFTVASRTDAAVVNLPVTLDGAQAGTASPGTGTATVALDPIAMTLGVNLSYSGLVAPTTNAHIHCCALPGDSAGILIPFLPAGFVIGVTSGTFNATFDLTSAQVADIASGLSYINIHTTEFGAGEIRGQIPGVPEPATFILLGSAFAAVYAARKRLASK